MQMAGISPLSLTKVPSSLSIEASSPCFRVPSNRSMFCYRSIKKYPTIYAATAETPTASSMDAGAKRRLYVGNIPRTVSNEELANIFGEHGSVEKAEVMYDKYSGRSRRFAFVTMASIDDADAAIEKLNEKEIGGRKIKVNVTEKPLNPIDLSQLQADESKFIDSPYKVYVGNLAKTVTTKLLTKLFSEKGKVLSAKVSRVPGTSKSSGFGFISFSSEEDVLFEGQKIRVNRA
ncbi:30S ribosomal protein 2, chloroplastic isoform X2 [Phalaenopsis equestris]|uniref:30S ribosomal protein 2, chloroplastic isoform X2 n=1 Tax=Phalaenopsis equestris TaxID=78828 RepID=UPI0009E525A1|nr:30S ribosomal protein 2, chloroplastic isoform X2 [Phalaenopsis equestris]